MKQFIFDNLFIIIQVCVALIVTLVTIFKKKTKVYSSIAGEILSILPVFIQKVERSGDGSTKKQEVFELIQAYLEYRYPDINYNQYKKFVADAIETILSTPQKKEKKL